VSAPPTDGSSFGDNTGQTRIRRCAELPVFTPEESIAEAERSIVAEGLALDSTRESIRDMFMPYGNVVYTWISKVSANEPEMYAIVSFEDSTAAVAALDAYLANPPVSSSPAVTVKSKVVWDAMRARERNHSVVIELEGFASSVMWRDVWNEITDLLRPVNLTMIYFLYTNGDACAYVTLADEKVAQIFMNEIFSAPRTVAGCNVAPRILSDKAELEVYWAKASAHTLERKKKQGRYTRSSEKRSAFSEQYAGRSGVVISVDGLPPGTGWRRLMTELRNLGAVVFLNYPTDSSKCYVRLKDALTAASVVEQLSEPNPVRLLGTVVSSMVLEGEDEAEYWRLTAEDRRKKKAENRGNDGELDGNWRSTVQGGGGGNGTPQFGSLDGTSSNSLDAKDTTGADMFSESVQQASHSG
jgi:hypothetical protein